MNKYGIHYSRKEYREEYLRSPEWAEKRKVILERDKICVCCKTNKATDPHHVTYKRIPFENLQTDLVGICRQCHQKIHRHAYLSKAGNIKKLVRRFEEVTNNPVIVEKRPMLSGEEKKRLAKRRSHKRKCRIGRYRSEGMIQVHLTKEQKERNEKFEKVRRRHSVFYQSCNARRHGRLNF